MESGIQSLQTAPVVKGGNSSGYNAFASPFGIYLIRESPVIKDYDDFISFKGKPLNKKKLIGDLSGFTQCSGVHLEGLSTATDSETAEIDTLIKAGIII